VLFDIYNITYQKKRVHDFFFLRDFFFFFFGGGGGGCDLVKLKIDGCYFELDNA
jgi:hypothetical protein